MTKSLLIQKELNKIKHKAHFNIQYTVEARTYTYSFQSYLNVC